MLGHEAALWFPTGTMANQVALRTLTRPGDEVLAPREAHILWHETGAAAAHERRPDHRDRAGRQHGPVQRRGRPRRAQAARPHAPAADDRRRRREHPQPRRRRRDRRGDRRRHRRRGARHRHRELPRRRAALERRGRAGRAHRRSRPPVRRRQRRVLEGPRRAGRLDARGLARLRHRGDALSPDGRRRDAPGRRLRGGRRATPSTITSTGWPTTTPTPASSPSGSPRARRSSSIRPPSRRTSSCSGWRTARRTRATVVAAARAAGVLVVAFSARTIRAVTHLDVTRDQVAEAAERLVAAAESGRSRLIAGRGILRPRAGPTDGGATMTFERNPGPPPEPGPTPVVGAASPGAGPTPVQIRLQILSTEHWSLLASRGLAWNEIVHPGRRCSSRRCPRLDGRPRPDRGRRRLRRCVLRRSRFVVLPVALFVGIGTWIRMGAANYHDAMTVVGMNRIRGAYLEIAPDLEPYFVMGVHDDARGIGDHDGRPARDRRRSSTWSRRRRSSSWS